MADLTTRFDGATQATAVVVDASRVTPEQTNAEKREAYLQLARDRFREVLDAEGPLREAMLEDKEFRASKQWPDDIQRAYQAAKIPCLTINRLPQFIRQITNQQRENRPAARVSAVDSLSDPKTASVFSGIIRHIESTSRAQVAYNTAAEDQVTIGRGFIRILTEYADPRDAAQSLVIKRVRNPFSIYMDPACEELDYSDAMYAFVVRDYRVAEYQARFKQNEPISAESFAGAGNQKADWWLGGSVRVAEYWTVEMVPDTLLILETQDTILLSELPPQTVVRHPERGIVGAMVGDQPVIVVGTRPVERREVRWSLINGIDILDGNEDRTGGRLWPGANIPIVPVIGEEIDINGKVDLRGIVRDAKDPQRRYNYSVSKATEIAGLAPKAPYVVAEGQDEGFEKEWETANVVNHAVLHYKPTTLDGQLVPPPQRNASEPPIQAMVMLTAQAGQDLMNVTGKYQASLGETGPEQSGRAIQARQRQGDIGSYNFQDNLNFAVATVCRYLVDLIPKVYDVARIVRILGEDGNEQAVMVHANGQAPAQPPEGVSGVFNVGVGRYDVTTAAGPSYASKRQEFVDMAMQLIQSVPQAGPVIFPMIARNMDIPYAQELADKLNKMLPPDLRDVKPGEPAPPSPEVQQQMAQMEQMIQALQAELVKANEIIRGKQVENASEEKQAQITADSRVRVAEIERNTVLEKTAAQIEADVALGGIKAHTADSTARTKAITTLLSSRASGEGRT